MQVLVGAYSQQQFSVVQSLPKGDTEFVLARPCPHMHVKRWTFKGIVRSHQGHLIPGKLQALELQHSNLSEVAAVLQNPQYEYLVGTLQFSKIRMFVD